MWKFSENKMKAVAFFKIICYNIKYLHRQKFIEEKVFQLCVELSDMSASVMRLMCS